MMRKTKINFGQHLLVLFCFLFYVEASFSQDYKESFKADICDCFTDEFTKMKRSKTAFQSCFKKALPTYAALIDAEIEEDNVNVKFNKGQKARQALKQEFEIELIYDCNLYFLSKEEERKKLLAKGLLRVSIADLESLNQKVAMYPNAATYLVRGSTQLFLGNLDEAEADVRESINLSSNKDNIRGIKEQNAILALILEEKKQFDQASNLYGKVYEATQDIEAAIHQALVNKKSGGAKTKLSINNDKKTNSNRVDRTRYRLDAKRKSKKDTENSDLKKLFKLDNSNKKKLKKDN